jgi:hypothetical protein
MPGKLNPDESSGNKIIVVEPQGNDSRTTSRSVSNNVSPAITPKKVSRPIFYSRIE